MLLAFLIKDEPDWKEWRRGVSEVGILSLLSNLASKRRVN